MVNRCRHPAKELPRTSEISGRSRPSFSFSPWEWAACYFETGVVSGVQAVAQHLAKHFPADGRSGNELPDKPVVL